MNLFQEETKDFLRPLIQNEEWIEVLSRYIELNRIKSLSAILKKERANYTIYPEPQAVFRIFKEYPFSKVKVVIVGQDPYYNGNADGIAFSCRNSISPSLNKIFTALVNDIYGIGTQLLIPKNLDYLINQGVFLYNPILTVRANAPLSHRSIGWEHFSDCVFKALSTKKDLIWLAWGKEAQSSITGKVNSNHTILSASHPASASYNNSIWECNHFSTVNNILKSQNKQTINWLK